MAVRVAARARRYAGIVESIGDTPTIELPRLAPSPDVRLFAKPKTLPNRRMGVALARSATLEQALATAVAAAAKVEIRYDD